MRKILSALLLAAMILALCACGSADQLSAGPTTEATVPTTAAQMDENSQATEEITPATTEASVPPSTEPTTRPTQPTKSEEKPAPSDGCSHKWSNWTTKKAATCTQQGSEERTCNKCGKTEQRTAKATGHSWDAGKETGSAITYTCKVCGSTKTEQITGDHTFGEWKWEEYTFKHSSGGKYTSHRKVRTCTKCGHKEVSGSDHICQKGSDNHQVTTVKEGTCSTKATMRSTCKICGWYVEYAGKKSSHTTKTETRHLTDYDMYTNELDALISECSSCGDRAVAYTQGKGWRDNNRYRNRISLSKGSAYMGVAPIADDFAAVDHPTWQTVKRNFQYDSEGYVSGFTIHWWYNGNRYSQTIKCGKGEMEAWFAQYNVSGGEGYTYQLRCYGTEWKPYKVSWSS